MISVSSDMLLSIVEERLNSLPSALVCRKTPSIDTILHNTIALYCPANGNLCTRSNKKSLSSTIVIKNKIKHPNFLPTKAIIIMVVAKISHDIIQIHVRLHGTSVKKSVGEICRSEAEST